MSSFTHGLSGYLRCDWILCSFFKTLSSPLWNSGVMEDSLPICRASLHTSFVISLCDHLITPSLLSMCPTLFITTVLSNLALWVEHLPPLNTQASPPEGFLNFLIFNFTDFSLISVKVVFFFVWELIS